VFQFDTSRLVKLLAPLNIELILVTLPVSQPDTSRLDKEYRLTDLGYSLSKNHRQNYLYKVTYFIAGAGIVFLFNYIISFLT